MNEIIQKYFNEIEYPNTINKSNSKNVSPFKSNGDNSISIDNSIEGLIDPNKLKLNEIDINNLESIRISHTFGNKERNSKILLDRMTSKQSPKIDNRNKDYEIKIINAINTNKGLDNYNPNSSSIYYENEEEDENLNININSKNNDTGKFNIKKNKYEENKQLLKKQNAFFVELLDDNDNKKVKDRNIIISNLYLDLNNLKENKKVSKIIKNKKDNEKFSINNKNGRYKKINNIPINRDLRNNKMIKKYNTTRNKKQYNNYSINNRTMNNNIINIPISIYNNNLNSKVNHIIKFNYKLSNNNSTKKINNSLNKVNCYNIIKNQSNKKISNTENNLNNKSLKKSKSKYNLFKGTSLINKNKSSKSIFLSNKKPHNSYKNVIIPIKKINNENNNNKKKKNNIPINNNKKINLNLKTFSKNISGNNSRNYYYKKNIISSNNNLIQLIKEYNKLLNNNKSLTKNNSFNNIFNIINLKKSKNYGTNY